MDAVEFIKQVRRMGKQKGGQFVSNWRKKTQKL